MASDESKLKLGVSACLLGEEVRFDGGHKRDRFLTDSLARFVDWVPVCPEVEAGLGIPRQSYRLARASTGAEERFVGSRSGDDETERLRDATQRLLDQLPRADLRGFVLKKGSPSCALLSARIYQNEAPVARDGAGIFARELVRLLPNLPVEEEGRLNDPGIRENFVCRIFSYDRWRKLRDGFSGWSDLVDFHAQHKMLLLAHSPAIAKELGQLVAIGAGRPPREALDEYEGLMMAALAKVASRGRHANALQHLAGFLKRELPASDRQELSGVVAEYAEGRVPIAVPLVLLGHHLRHYPDEWANSQTYLQPYPLELALRSEI